jgi:hypothetical protein
MARPSTKLTPSAPSFTVQAVLPAELGPRIQALRIEGPNIFSVSTVIREAIRRGLAQLELERSLGRSLASDPSRPLSPQPLTCDTCDGHL